MNDFDLKTKIAIDRIEKSRKMYPIVIGVGARVNQILLNHANTLIAICADSKKLIILNGLNF